MKTVRRRLLGATAAAAAAPWRALSALPALAPGVAADAAAAAPGSAGALAWPRLRLLDGTQVEPSHWHGRPAVLVFWATWCAYCKRHNDRLQALLDGRPADGPRLLALAVDGDAAGVARHVRAQGWTFPVALDGGRLRPLVSPRTVVPLTVVVDARGVVRERIPGEMAEADLRPLLALRT